MWMANNLVLAALVSVAIATAAFYFVYRFLEDYLLTPRIMARNAHPEHCSTGWTKIGPVPFHARNDLINIRTIVIAQPHHVRRTSLLHFRRSAVLGVCAGN